MGTCENIHGSSDNSLQVVELLWLPSEATNRRKKSYKLLSTIFLQNCFSVFFLKVGQFAAAKLTQYSTKPHRPSDASRLRLRLLLSGDVQQKPGSTTKYPCSVCIRNVTSREVNYQCNNCKNWVHEKWSKFQSKQVQARQEMGLQLM